MNTASPGSTPTPDPPPFESRTAQGATFALVVLFSMNLLNYMDRYVFASVGEPIINEFGIRDSQFGYLAASFMIVYTLVSPAMGWLGDRYHRRRLLAFGVALWSFATVGTALAQSYHEMFLWRALLGIGEASYGVIAPTLLADLFDPRYRGRVLGIYFLALPVGGALGYGVGGYIATHSPEWGSALTAVFGEGVGDLIAPILGWRASFFVVGLPGLFAALLALVIPDPGRGASEGRVHAETVDGPKMGDYLNLFKTRSFMYNIGGMAAVTFTTGAYAVWAPTFFARVRGMELKVANYWIGGLTATAGLLGIALGAWLADWLLKYTRRAYMLWAGLAVLGAVPFGILGILIPDQIVALSLLFVAMVLLASTLGPCNTVTANVVPANQRAAGYAVSIFLLHLFGDISSPMIIGLVSDLFGRDTVALSAFGQLMTNIGIARVGTQNLTAGMLVVVPALVLGSFFLAAGSRHLPADQERARRQSGSDALVEAVPH